MGTVKGEGVGGEGEVKREGVGRCSEEGSEGEIREIGSWRRGGSREGRGREAQ